MPDSWSEEPTSLGAPADQAGSTGLTPGTTIGHYRIVRLIGEGGMGAVYEAEQEQPRRTVALKVIRPGLSSPALLHRFAQESQALGRLQHVGIAQIYEAGTADAGFGPQPYFAMEFIRGRSLKEYLAGRQSSVNDRLDLVARICDAVQHAHQRGLVHRDLKPGNILVDEAGQPKVLDFGVARVTDADAQGTMHTHVGEIVGTLSYMSPEQVMGDPANVDARSDVYTLGVILYEVLADRLPYDVSKKLPEAVAAICEQDPKPLSGVQRVYKGDIETIAAKALEKDKTRRYASAASMAEDIRRYLRDEPIVARPPSVVYQAGKLVRRHKTLAAGAAAVVVMGAIGLVATSWQSRRASVAEQSVAEARDRATAAESLTESMPLDPAVTHGELPNGLRYYIRSNKQPAHRIELRLVVKAGSVLEDEDQRGLAHVIEHMAFESAKHFPGGIGAFLKSKGLRFGLDFNAGTSFDQTTFVVSVPTETPGALDWGLTVAEDWAHGLSFEAADLDRARSVVLEEWRTRLGAGSRTTDRLFPTLLKGTFYATRIPIGLPEQIRTFTPDQLRRFYRDWYRPDLMAVAVVGDLEPAAAEALVKSHFSAVAPPENTRPRPSYDVDRPSTTYAILTDPEMTSTSVEVDSLLPARVQGTVNVYRLKIVDQLLSGMLSARLGELAQAPDAPFLSAGASRSLFIVPSREQTTLSAVTKADGIERALDALMIEVERVTRFGFTATELERRKAAELRRYEQLKSQAQARTSASEAEECVRNFLHQETIPGAAIEYDLHRRLLPQITLDDVNKAAKEWFSERGRMVIVTARQTTGGHVPNNEALAHTIAAASARTLTPYVDTGAASVLLDQPPAPGRIVTTAVKEAVGITEWALSNGVRVVVKPTTFKADEIVFRATKPGGTSLASDQDYIPASTAVQAVTAGGLGRLSAVDLKKLLTSKIASATPFITEVEHGLSGGGSRADLETLFQLIFLRFTQPRRDEPAFAVLKDQLKTQLGSQEASPQFAFAGALAQARFQNHLRRRPQTAAMVDGMDLDKSLAFYKERFGDASGFTFIFVGSAEPAVLRPLAERYLGALPSSNRGETWRDVGVRSATGVVEKKVEVPMIQPQGRTSIVFAGPFPYQPLERVLIRAMTNVLQSRLVATIRESLGGTYGITVTPTYARVPISEYTISIDFGSDPGRTDELVRRTLEEIEVLRSRGPADAEVAAERSALLREFEASSQQNSYLLTNLSARYQAGEDPSTLWSLPDLYRACDAAAVRTAAQKYLDPAHYVRVSLAPAKK